MAEPLSVVLYGDSVVLAGIGKSLEGYSRLRVFSLAPSPTTTPQEIEALRPTAVIVDLGVVSTEFAFSLLPANPDLLVIGLDPGGDRLLVLSGQQARRLSTEDLVHLIDRRPRGRARPPRRDTSGDTLAPGAMVARSPLGTTSV
ncbi:MAG: hypothetical protein ACYC4L_08510 [Chloroflexota bacterium]